MSDQSSAGDGTTTPTGGPDPLVSLAFALGWQMADLYRNPAKKADAEPDEKGLPGAGSLKAGPRTALGIDQLQAGLHRLAPRLTKAGAMAPPLADVRVVFATGDRDAIRDQLYLFHVSLITVLTAADFKLGKAYGLGRALSDTVHPQDYPHLHDDWNEFRLTNVVGWLADLASAFPPHSARAVVLSIERWEFWLGKCSEGALWGLPASENPTWTPLGKLVRRRLLGQGRRWRALLSGEKLGTDMLATEDYVNAAGRALSSVRATTGKLLWKFREVVALAVALLVLGVVLALASEDTAKILAGAGAALSGLGISWKTLGTGFKGLAEQLRDPVWGAEVDEAIAGAITLLPDDRVDKPWRWRQRQRLRRLQPRRAPKDTAEAPQEAPPAAMFTPSGPYDADVASDADDKSDADVESDADA